MGTWSGQSMHLKGESEKYYRAMFRNSFKVFKFYGKFYYVKLAIFYILSFQIFPNYIFNFYNFYTERTQFLQILVL